MTDNLYEWLSAQSVLMLTFSLLSVGIMLACFLLTLCYNCTCNLDREDTTSNPAPIMDIEKEFPRQLHKQNPIAVRWGTTTNPEEMITTKSSWKNKEILI